MKKRVIKQLISLNLILLTNLVLSQNITLKYTGNVESTIELSYDSNNNINNIADINNENKTLTFQSKNQTTLFCSNVRSRTQIYVEPNDIIEFHLNKDEQIEYSSKNNKYRKTESEFINECYTKYGANEIESTKKTTAKFFAKDYNLSTYIDGKYIKEQELLEDYYKKDKVSKPFYDYFKTMYWCLTLNNLLENNPIAASTFLDIEKSFSKAHELFENKEYRALLVNYNLKKIKKHKIKEDLQSTIQFIIAQKYLPEVKDFLLFQSMDSYIKEHPNTNNIPKETIILFRENCKNPDYLRKIYHDLQPKTIPPYMQDILKKYVGKLVLIDFWASYCMPCLAEFPSEKKLMQKYPDMAFVFFSTDNINESWQKSMEKYPNILNKDNSFLLTKSNHDELTKKINLISIPRYILIGKDGEIIDVDAPRPSSKEITILIEKYL
jgi:thiol-disulfide isomerase/thioredoxin